MSCKNDKFYMFLIAATEWIGASKRSWGVCVTQLFSAVGQCVLAGVIYAIRHWRLAQLITAAPLGVVVVYIWCVLTLFNCLLLFLFVDYTLFELSLPLLLSGLFQSQPDGCSAEEGQKRLNS